MTVTQALSMAKMALLRHLQPKDGLPDPKGSLSSEVPAAAIARANQQVQAASETVREERKRAAYHRYIQPRRLSHEHRDPLCNPPFF